LEKIVKKCSPRVNSKKEMFNKLISKNNLLLAWRRITTSGNSQYKKFYRNLYSIFEVAVNENIKYLNQNLKANIYKPKFPERTYLPKPSGLQRPITFLFIEDQIILQAFANLLADKIREKRKEVERKVVFSNYLNKSSDIFFVKPWRQCYKDFQNAITEQFNSGYKWVGHFDLAAFYDTISHDLLLKQLVPRGEDVEVLKFLRKCLKTWTKNSYSHGIPQGPSASDLLAECFLLPLDLEMIKRKHRYFRYVDDIRLFGKNETEVRKALIDLELLCRERGLIPQSSKHSILKAQRLKDVLGNMPSIQDIDIGIGSKFFVRKTETKFKQSLDIKKNEIINKSIAKFILYRSPRSRFILKHVLKLLPHQPHFIDAYISFLTQYSHYKKVKKMCWSLIIEDFPYDYVVGELWKLFSLDIDKNYNAMRDLAVKILQDKSKHKFSSRLGAAIFLNEYEKRTGQNYSNFLLYEHSLIQAFTTPHIPVNKLQGSSLLTRLLTRTDFEVSMAVIRQLMYYKIDFPTSGVAFNKLPQQTQNVMCGLGYATGVAKTKIDLIGQILTNEYNITKWTGWKTILGSEYGHALMFLRSAVSVQKSNRSDWLMLTNSFNDSIYRVLQIILASNHAPGVMSTVYPDGQLKEFGGLVNPNCAFDKAYPALCASLRIINARRNRLPQAHPYDKKTGARAKPLDKKEQILLRGKVVNAYNEIVRICIGLGIN